VRPPGRLSPLQQFERSETPFSLLTSPFRLLRSTAAGRTAIETSAALLSGSDRLPVRDDAGRHPGHRPAESRAAAFWRRIRRDRSATAARLHEDELKFRNSRKPHNSENATRKNAGKKPMKMYESSSFRRTRHSRRRLASRMSWTTEVAGADQPRQSRHAIDDGEERRLGAEQDDDRQHRRA
jgi:hypothetical protein